MAAGRESVGTTYVIVLTWNGREDTLACLSSLVPILSGTVKAVVVDNGSTDGTADAVRASYPGIEVLELAENMGFSAGNNAGIRHALGKGAEYVVLLNNDTVVDGNFVDALLAASREVPGKGFYCSKIYFFDRPEILWFAGATFDGFTGRSVHIGYGERDTGRYDSIREIERPCGCAVMVTRKFLEEVGLLEEALFLYGEEIDWMIRAKRKGYGCVLVPRSTVRHKVSVGTGGALSGNVPYYTVRNTLFTLNRLLPMRTAWGRHFRNLAVVLVVFMSVFTSRLAIRNSIRSICSGIKDYASGVTGKRRNGTGPSPGCGAPVK